MVELLSAQKSLDSGILKLAPSPGVNSAIKLLYMPAHYCEYQHPWYLNEKKAWQTFWSLHFIKLQSFSLPKVKSIIISYCSNV